MWLCFQTTQFILTWFMNLKHSRKLTQECETRTLLVLLVFFCSIKHPFHSSAPLHPQTPAVNKTITFENYYHEGNCLQTILFHRIYKSVILTLDPFLTESKFSRSQDFLFMAMLLSCLTSSALTTFLLTSLTTLSSSTSAMSAQNTPSSELSTLSSDLLVWLWWGSSLDWATNCFIFSISSMIVDNPTWQVQIGPKSKMLIHDYDLDWYF